MTEYISKESERYKTADKLLKVAAEFWQACHKEGQYGAVQWLTGDSGELVIYTRGEYRETLLQNIDVIGTPVERFGEAIDRRQEDLRAEQQPEKTNADSVNIKGLRFDPVAQFYEREVYGTKKIYPANAVAEKFAEIAGTVTLTPHTIQCIKKLGIVTQLVFAPRSEKE